ncbi:hypothetical protein [Actinosynnema sp. NPDC020468]|uniref:hypothetical protein n=1 Tax=Actinosynnema sp. NPDC020468 TaxID=3154488 RepID=UPI0033FE21D0
MSLTRIATATAVGALVLGFGAATLGVTSGTATAATNPWDGRALGTNPWDGTPASGGDTTPAPGSNPWDLAPTLTTPAGSNPWD